MNPKWLKVQSDLSPRDKAIWAAFVASMPPFAHEHLCKVYGPDGIENWEYGGFTTFCAKEFEKRLNEFGYEIRPKLEVTS